MASWGHSLQCSSHHPDYLTVYRELAGQTDRQTGKHFFSLIKENLAACSTQRTPDEVKQPQEKVPGDATMAMPLKRHRRKRRRRVPRLKGPWGIRSSRLVVTKFQKLFANLSQRTSLLLKKSFHFPL